MESFQPFADYTITQYKPRVSHTDSGMGGPVPPYWNFLGCPLLSFAIGNWWCYISKVLIVAGGVIPGSKLIDTSEKHVIGENNWRMIKTLPRVMSGLTDGTISMNNKIYIFGKQGPVGDYLLTMKSLCCRWLQFACRCI